MLTSEGIAVGTSLEHLLTLTNLGAELERGRVPSPAPTQLDIQYNQGVSALIFSDHRLAYHRGISGPQAAVPRLHCAAIKHHGHDSYATVAVPRLGVLCFSESES